MQIAAGVGVTLLLILVITLSVTLTKDKSKDGSTNVPSPALSNPVTFEEFVRGTYSARGFSGSWWDDEQIQLVDSDGDLVLWNVRTNENVTIAFDSDDLPASAKLVAYAPNSETLALLRADVESVFRHTTLAHYFIYDSATGSTYPVYPPAADIPADDPEPKLQYAAWLPHPTLNRVVFVYKNNVLVRVSPDGPQTTVYLTTDGIDDNIYNGIPDWVYEEEILSTDNALYFSPQGGNLAYARFNDLNVRKRFPVQKKP